MAQRTRLSQSSGRRHRRRGPDGPLPGGAADDTPDADPESVARAIVLRRLAAAPRSRADLAATLAERDVPDEVATRVLDRFEELALVDDQAYAEMLVRSRRATRGLARAALARELRQHGIADELAQAALAGLDSDDELETARALVHRRLAATRGLDRATRVRRLAAMLARKGYPPATCLRAVDEALTESAEEAEEDGGTPA